MKEFKARKIKKRKRSIILIIFILFFFFSYVYMFLYLSKHRLNKNVINKDISYINFNMLKYVDDKVKVAINNPVSLLEFKTPKVIKLSSKKNDLNTNNVEEYNPVIYLYNTHQSERYSNYSVYDATYLLANELHNDKFYTYFEENSIPTFLNSNKMKYYESYKASRYYLNKTYNNYNTLKYFFDIHRDSVSKDKVTLNFNNKTYAKILFIVGLENSNYESNLKETERLNSIVNNIVPNLSRGIYKKAGKNVNGVYNQDLNKYVFLIEVGSVNSNKDEVTNTINVLKDAIERYVLQNDQL